MSNIYLTPNFVESQRRKYDDDVIATYIGSKIPDFGKKVSAVRQRDGLEGVSKFLDYSIYGTANPEERFNPDSLPVAEEVDTIPSSAALPSAVSGNASSGVGFLQPYTAEQLAENYGDLGVGGVAKNIAGNYLKSAGRLGIDVATGVGKLGLGTALKTADILVPGQVPDLFGSKQAPESLFSIGVGGFKNLIETAATPFYKAINYATGSDLDAEKIFDDPETEELALSLGKHFDNRLGITATLKGVGNLLTGNTDEAKSSFATATQQLSKTGFEDPFGLMSDVMSLVTAGAGATKLAGKASQFAGAAKLGSALSSVSDDVLRFSIAADPSDIVAKSTVKTAGKAVGMAKGVAGYGVRQLTGLADDTIKTLLKVEGVDDALGGGITRETVAGKVFKATKAKLDELSATGKAYELIRKSKQVVNIGDNFLDDVLGNFGLSLGDDGKLIITAESVPMKAGDIAALEDWIRLYAKGKELSANAFLNARKSLDEMAKWDAAKSGTSKAVSRYLRGKLDKLGKEQLIGLDELDKQYRPLVQEARQLQKEYIDFIPGADGDVPVLSDRGLRKIANLKPSTRANELQRIERLVPGITDDIRALRAVEDIAYANNRTIGTYARGGLLAVGVGTGNVPAIITSILASPTIVVPIIRLYGKANRIKNKVINSIVDKIKSGTRLASKEADIMSDAIKYVDEMDNSFRVDSEARLPDLQGATNNIDDIAKAKMAEINGIDQVSPDLQKKFSNLTPEEIM